MAPRAGVASDLTVPAQLWTAADDIPAPKLLDVLTQIAHFLDQIGYSKSFNALCKESTAKNSLAIDIDAWKKAIESETATPLLNLYEEWHEGHDKFPTLTIPEATDVKSSSESESDDDSDSVEGDGVLVDSQAEETSDDDSDEKSSDTGSEDSSNSSESDSSASSAVAGAKQKPALTTPSASSTMAGAKRKRIVTPPSSSDASSSSDDDSDSDSSSSSDSDARPAKKARASEPASASSSDSISSSSNSDSSSSSVDSDSTSSDSSDSDSSSAPAPKVTQKAAKKGDKVKKNKPGTEADAAVKKNGKSKSKDDASQSSATLEAESSPEKELKHEEPTSHVHPDRMRQVPTTKKENAAHQKKQQIPFSRIPADQQVDPRFASNEYVSYDYADRAHRDLIVTKGKGFTKEKNKKKRGSYRGGIIDLTPKGIKFDD